MDYQLTTLKNGVRVITVPMDGVESLAVGVYVGAGTREETKETNGIAHFLEHMVFKGTKKFTTKKDTSILEGYGSIQNAYTYSDATAYWAKIPANLWRLGLEVQKEFALNPLLREKDIAKERGVILQEIARRNDTPEDKVWEVFYHMRYPSDSLGWSTLGLPEVIKKVNAADFSKFHKDFYKSGDIVVALAGKLPRESEYRQAIKSWFSDLPARKTTVRIRPTPISEAKVALEEKKDAQQAHIVLGVTAFDLHDPRQYTLSVLNRILGFGLSSRLFMEVREKRGLAYEVYSDAELQSDHGYFAVYAGVQLEKVEDAVKAIMNEFKKLADKKVPAKELEHAKEKVRGPVIFARENPYSQMEFYAKQALWTPTEIETYDQILKKIMKVASEDVRKLAQDLFVKQKLNLAIIGPYKDSSRFEKLLMV